MCKIYYLINLHHLCHFFILSLSSKYPSKTSVTSLELKSFHSSFPLKEHTTNICIDWKLIIKTLHKQVPPDTENQTLHNKPSST